MNNNNLSTKNKNEASDNEYEISRTYKFKKTTLKKLYQLKANEDEFNIKFNSIVEAAIDCYYDKIFKS